MSMKSADLKEEEKEYKDETQRRWGETKAYQESAEKTAQRGEEESAVIKKEMNAIMKEFAAHTQDDPQSEILQDLVRRWQEHLTKYYYQADREILAALGKMYIADKRFQDNIDKYGKGTAKILSQAIAVYTSHK